MVVTGVILPSGAQRHDVVHLGRLITAPYAGRVLLEVRGTAPSPIGVVTTAAGGGPPCLLNATDFGTVLLTVWRGRHDGVSERVEPGDARRITCPRASCIQARIHMASISSSGFLSLAVPDQGNRLRCAAAIQHKEFLPRLAISGSHPASRVPGRWSHRGRDLPSFRRSEYDRVSRRPAR